MSSLLPLKEKKISRGFFASDGIETKKVQIYNIDIRKGNVFMIKFMIYLSEILISL